MKVTFNPQFNIKSYTQNIKTQFRGSFNIPLDAYVPQEPKEKEGPQPTQRVKNITKTFKIGPESDFTGVKMWAMSEEDSKSQIPQTITNALKGTNALPCEDIFMAGGITNNNHFYIVFNSYYYDQETDKNSVQYYCLVSTTDKPTKLQKAIMNIFNDNEELISNINREMALSSKFSRLGKKTIILENLSKEIEGNVLFDTENDEKFSDNHLDREEIQKAFNENEGSSVRYSKTSSSKLVYYATKIDDNTVVRSSVPISAIIIFLSRNFKYYIFIIITVIILALGLSVKLTRIIIYPIKELESISSSIVKSLTFSIKLLFKPLFIPFKKLFT
jgi:hypothetical protein